MTLERFQHRWSTPVPRLITEPPVVHRRIVLSKDLVSVTATNPDDGALRWQRTVPSESRIEWAVLDDEGVVSCGGHGGHWIVEATTFEGGLRYRKALECVASEAVCWRGNLWILVKRGVNSCLIQLDALGEVSGRWPIPEGCTGLCGGAAHLLWYAPSQGESLWRFDPARGAPVRIYSGRLVSVRSVGSFLVLGRPDGGLTVTDDEGRIAWEASNLGLEPGVSDQIYACRERDGVWRPSCVELATGQVRWEIPWDDADRTLKLTPLGAQVAIWDMANVDLVDAREGTRVQTLSPPGGGRFTAVGAEGYLSGLLVLAGRRALHGYAETTHARGGCGGVPNKSWR